MFNNNNTQQFNTFNNPTTPSTPMFQTAQFSNPQPSPFSNNNTPMFGNNTTGTTTSSNPMFGNNPSTTAGMGNNMFNNNNAGTQNPMFGNNTGTPANTNNTGTFMGMVGGALLNGGGMFNNTANNMFGGANSPNTANTANTSNTMFNNGQTSTNTGNNMFGGMFSRGNTATANNTNTNTNNANMNINTNMQQNNFMGALVDNDYIAFAKQMEYSKLQLEECIRRLRSKNIENIHLDGWNIYAESPLNKLPFKDGVIKILNNFQDLQKMLKNLKDSNTNIQTKMVSFTKETHKKLNLYKQCLLQSVTHNKIIEQVGSQLDLMTRQLQEYFRPLYNAYKTKKKVSIKQPNQFDLKISYDVLNKFQILNQRVDDMIACQMPVQSQEVQSTIAVFQQLVQYYQNVSCSFKEFSGRYNLLKRAAIDRESKATYEAVMSKVLSKVQDNFKREFKYYDLIKEIDDLLNEKDKREEKRKIQAQMKYDAFTTRRTF